ncbi:MAG: indole-3-glycerol phosphate synthase TrpC [Methanomicrobiales archaeon]
MPVIMDEILRRTRERVAALPAVPDSDRQPVSLTRAIRECRDRNPVIAEIKFASPSRGPIHPPGDPATIAREYLAGGAVAISVLTEPFFFGGSPEKLAAVRRAVSVPILRKDFIIDHRQLPETKALGADAVLLIAAVLGPDLARFVDDARELGLEPLVEVHTREEADLAQAAGADLIGINNRDLRTMSVDLTTTRRLAGHIGPGRTIVSESGIRWPFDVRTLRDYCDGFLIGSALMADADRKKKLEGFVYA